MGALPVSKKERCREGKNGIGPRMKCGHATHKAKNGLPNMTSRLHCFVGGLSLKKSRRTLLSEPSVGDKNKVL